MKYQHNVFLYKCPECYCSSLPSSLLKYLFLFSVMLSKYALFAQQQSVFLSDLQTRIWAHTLTSKKPYFTVAWVKMCKLIHVEGIALPTSVQTPSFSRILVCWSLVVFLQNVLDICKHLIHRSGGINPLHFSLLLVQLYNGPCGLQVRLDPFL